ncbi:MAG: sodium:solute symporter family protein, partial [Desulfurococcaceae archaeon]
LSQGVAVLDERAVVASTILFSITGASIAIGVLAARGVKALRADTYIVAGRTLGTVVFFLNTAAVIYSGYTFLGLSGYSYTYGAATIFAWGTSLLGYSLGYLTAPRLWRIARDNGLLTLSDFIMWRYGSRLLTIASALTSIIFQLPYIQLQIRSVAIIVDSAAYGSLQSMHVSIAVFALVMAYVFMGGMISIALTNVLLGAIMLAAMLGGSWAIIIKYFGSLGGLYEAVERVSALHLVMPGPRGDRPISWFITASLGTALGFWCWSQRIQSLFTAKSSRTVERGMVLGSWYYVLGGLWVTQLGLAAIAIKAAVGHADYTFLRLADQAFGPIALGLVASGGVGASLSTAAGLLLDEASTLSKNILQYIFKDKLSDQRLVWSTRAMVVGFGILGIYLAYTSPALLVDLLLLGYAGVTQLFPALFLGLYVDLNWREVLVGLAAGLATVTASYLWNLEKELGIHSTIIALAVNLAALAFLRALRKKQ